MKIVKLNYLFFLLIFFSVSTQTFARKVNRVESITSSGEENKITNDTNSTSSKNLENNKGPSCWTNFEFDQSGKVGVRTNSPDISENFQKTEFFDDDGYLGMMIVFRSVKQRIGANSEKNISLNPLEASYYKAAIERMHQYASAQAPLFEEGGDYYHLKDDRKYKELFKEYKASNQEFLDLADELTLMAQDGKVSLKQLDKIGRNLQSYRDKRFYSPKPLKGNNLVQKFDERNDMATTSVCSRHAGRSRCCTKQNFEFNNLLAQSLCDVNFETMEKENSVFDPYNEKSSCSEHEITLGGQWKNNIQAPKYQNKDSQEKN